MAKMIAIDLQQRGVHVNYIKLIAIPRRGDYIRYLNREYIAETVIFTNERSFVEVSCKKVK